MSDDLSSHKSEQNFISNNLVVPMDQQPFFSKTVYEGESNDSEDHHEVEEKKYNGNL